MNKDIGLIGDNQNKQWRDFDKQLTTDGVNDRLQTIELTQNVRVGKSFTIAMWCKPITFNISPYLIDDCIIFYAYSSNNLGIANDAQQINEILIDFYTPTNFRFNIIARNGKDDSNCGMAILGGNFNIFDLNETFHICFTNDFTGGENFWNMYVNGIKVAFGLTDFFNSGQPNPPKSGIVLPADVNYISGFGFVKNRNNLVTAYSNSAANELIFANVAITSNEVRQLFHSQAGNYANYPTNLMNNRLLHLPMNNVSDFTDNGANILVTDLANGNDAVLTGQTYPPTLNSFY